MEDQELLTLSLPTLAGGAVNELFEDELKRVLENIVDPNTDAEATRSINLKLIIRPALDRDSAAVRFEANSKLAPTLGIGTAMFIGRHQGELVAVEHNPKQLQLDLDAKSTPAEFPVAAQKDGEEDGTTTP